MNTTRWSAGQRRAVKRAFYRLAPAQCAGCFVHSAFVQTVVPSEGFRCSHCGHLTAGVFRFNKVWRMDGTYWVATFQEKG